MRKCQDTYKEVREYTYANAFVQVHIPDLTAEVRAERMKEIHRAAELLILAGMKAEAERRKRG